MSCGNYKIDSNVTGLAYAVEECLKVLPANPIFHALEPNSYSDFGGTINTVARSPIDPSRQNKKGSVVGLEASGGFNTDLTRSNIAHLMEGFCFNSFRKVLKNFSFEDIENPCSSVNASGVYTFSENFLNFGFSTVGVGDIVFIEDSFYEANNGAKLVTAATANTFTVEGSTTAETNSNIKFTVVGREFQSGDLTITMDGGVATLQHDSSFIEGSYPILGILAYPGTWFFAQGFEQGDFYFKTGSSLSDDAVVIDEATIPLVAGGGTGVIRIYGGETITNTPEGSIPVRKTYTIERKLGEGANSAQAEYLIGAVANELTISIPQEDKVSADIAFIACDNTYRSGDVDDYAMTTTSPAIPAHGDDAFNTSSDVYRIKMSVGSNQTNKDSLFGYVSEASISVSNGITPLKAVGVLGAFDTSSGNFTVSGNVTAYFTTTAAVKAIRANADVGLNVILAKDNYGIIIDVPLVALGGGRLNVEKDTPITVPLEASGAQNKYGYTLSYTSFKYLPAVAMAQ